MASVESNLPDVHGVDERRGTISGPQALVGELRNIPHELVHHLRQLHGVSTGAGAATRGPGAGTVRDVALMVRAVKVLSVPASTHD